VGNLEAVTTPEQVREENAPGVEFTHGMATESRHDNPFVVVPIIQGTLSMKRSTRKT